MRRDPRRRSRDGARHAAPTPTERYPAPGRRDRLRARRLRRGLCLVGGVAALCTGLAAGRSAERWLDRVAGPQPSRVERLSIQGASRLAGEELAAASGVAPGTALAEVDVAAVAARLAAHPWVAEARAATLPPDRLLVSVVEREPAARTAGEGGPWWVDAEGVPFAPVEAAAAEPGPAPAWDGLPRLVGGGELEPGRPHPRLAQAVRLGQRFEERGLPRPERIEVGGAEAGELPAVVLGAPPLRVVIGPGELDEKLERLALLLDARVGLGTTGEIDLRFGDRLVLRSGEDGGTRSSPEGGDGATRGKASPERGPAG